MRTEGLGTCNSGFRTDVNIISLSLSICTEVNGAWGAEASQRGDMKLRANKYS